MFDPVNEPLDEIEVRVLGSLMEKELTTPDYYPLTLKALTAACNQTSSRDPVMDLDEQDVARGLDRLAKRSLARGIHPSSGRVMRYRQEIGESLHLHRPERAALSVLMLRGPQTPGEIRTRTARVVEFVDPSHVEIVLDSLAALSTPLVIALPRQPGQKEARYTHLLAGAPAPDERAEAPRDRTPRDEGPRGELEGPDRPPSDDRGAALDGARAADPDPDPRPDRSGRVAALEEDVASLRREVAELRSQLEAFQRQFE